MAYFEYNCVNVPVKSNFQVNRRKGSMKSKIEEEKIMNAVGGIRITPVGPILVAASAQGITRVHLSTMDEFESEAIPKIQIQDYKAKEILNKTIQQIQEYFEGKRKRFEVLIDWSGLSSFAQRVLRATYEIRFGQINTYGNIARDIGQGKASRAVGGALGHNPFALIVPCHRVIARDGGLQGFSSPGGIRTKLWLLEFEGRKMKDGKVVL